MRDERQEKKKIQGEEEGIWELGGRRDGGELAGYLKRVHKQRRDSRRRTAGYKQRRAAGSWQKRPYWYW